MKPNPVLASLIVMTIGLSCFSGCRSKTAVEVIDLNKVLDIYDRLVKSKEDSALDESEKLSASSEENTEDTTAFLKLFTDALNQANLIKSPVAVDMQSSGIIRGFLDRDKNGVKDVSNSKEPELFTLEFDTQGNRIIATQKVAGTQYRRDHHYGSAYNRYYFYHRMHSAMWYRQNRYYSSSRPSPNYSGFKMSSATYHSAAVSRAQSVAQASSRSSSRSSARGSGRSGSFSSGK